MLRPFLLVLTTLPSQPHAQKIARLLLKKRLAACVNLIGPVQSSFWWKGKIDRAKEYLLLIKTRSNRFISLRRFLEKNHPYTVPEIIAIPIEKGNASYLKWLMASVR